MGALAVGMGLGATGCSSDGSNPASHDVKITGCSRDADNHRALVTGTVHNGSSKRSSYAIQIDVKANDSKVESGFASVLRLASGSSKSFTIHGIGVDVPSGTKVTCTVTHVGRTVAV